MDDDGDWITARYLLSSILGRNPLVVDYVDEESFPVNPPPAGAAGLGGWSEALAISPPPAVRASAGVAGTVCAVCTEEIAVADSVVGLPCAHWYHAGCIAPWLGIRSTCPMCRAELPPRDDEANAEDGGGGREKPSRARAAAGTSDIAGSSASASARRDASSFQYLAGGVLSG
ncbi:uncharacterized protein LOC133902092 [Phragmites australis]|uniref:uncharacterized protein LOC133902092 n=1 Tax=Phragmites australis TaxID=29695 RepID=UPI002D79DDB7|nr:uncharacterized protein LOC133902092 [Phragmites australis]